MKQEIKNIFAILYGVSYLACAIILTVAYVQGDDMKLIEALLVSIFLTLTMEMIYKLL